MNINNIVFLIICLILIPDCLYGTQNEDENIPLKLRTITRAKKPMRNDDYGNNPACKPSRLSNSLFLKLKFWKNKSGNYSNNIALLPKEISRHIGGFLDSVSILWFSNVNRDLRQIFNEDFWLSYMSKAPKAYSRLRVNNAISPTKNRKEFFAHLWYCEGHIHLAAELNHPEATILINYGPYGARIKPDQYLCPSGFIRHMSGEIDHEQTDTLEEAQRIKAILHHSEQPSLWRPFLPY